MPFCSNCGQETPQEALYCPSCGARVGDAVVARSGLSPSYLNSGTTATAEPYTTVPEDPGFLLPHERRRPSGRRGFLVVAIVALAVLLVGITFETGMPSSGGDSSVLNTPDTPLTGQQVYSAYAANQSQARAAYANKTLYIQDTLDSGVGHDTASDRYYSSVAAGSVVLVWSNSSQVGQLYAGALVLAKCLVEGLQTSQNAGNGIALYLRSCDLISVTTQTVTSSAPSAPIANL